MHLEIIQSADRTENVLSATIEKLYEIVKSNQLDNTSALEGTIKASTAYQDAINYL